MTPERSRGWESLRVVASLAWIAAVALYAAWQHDKQTERLRYWADSVEWTIDADPTVQTNAVELRTRLGDEKFIAAAAAAYPRVDLRDTLQRCQIDLARHPLRRQNAFILVLWSLAPPALLYFLGFAAARLRPL